MEKGIGLAGRARILWRRSGLTVLAASILLVSGVGLGLLSQRIPSHNVDKVVVSAARPVNTPVATTLSEPTQAVALYTAEELEALSLTLAGECYDDEAQDKYNVAWTVCNRAADGRFGESIIEVITSKVHAVQFVGYWNQSRSVTESDITVAADVLAAYYSGDGSPHNYLYFTGGTGKTNTFR